MLAVLVHLANVVTVQYALESPVLFIFKTNCGCFLSVLHSPTNTCVICADVVTFNNKVSEGDAQNHNWFSNKF